MLGHVALGSWSGGRFMRFGEPIAEERLEALLRPGNGIRSVITADAYGAGEADALVGRGLKRCGVDSFDLLLLHNPDRRGFESAEVCTALRELRDDGLTRAIGVAPGPANGFTLDLIGCFERYGELIDWAMVILNPLEPWPGELVLDAAARFEVGIVTRVVDYGGLFHDDLLPGHAFPRGGRVRGAYADRGARRRQADRDQARGAGRRAGAFPAERRGGRRDPRHRRQHGLDAAQGRHPGPRGGGPAGPLGDRGGAGRRGPPLAHRSGTPPAPGRRLAPDQGSSRSSAQRWSSSVSSGRALSRHSA